MITRVVIFFMLQIYSLAYAADVSTVSVSTSGQIGNFHSTGAGAINADGHFVAFESSASNLVENDTNDKNDIFVRNQLTGVTQRISLSSSGEQANGSSFIPSISADGRFVAFISVATNLVPGDTNNKADVFVHNRNTGLTQRANLSSSGKQANERSLSPSLSAGGRFVVFSSAASNLVDGDSNSKFDIFVHDLNTGTTERVSMSSTNVEGNNTSSKATISADGRLVAFESYASNLVTNDTNNSYDIFVHDRGTGNTQMVSKSSTGLQGEKSSNNPSISADGRYVTFDSAASRLVRGDTYYGHRDIFVHDRLSGITERVSVSSANVEGNSSSTEASISADGRFVAFKSHSNNLVENDRNKVRDIFIHDRGTGRTKRASVSSTGSEANYISRLPLLSANGRFVTFNSAATNLIESGATGYWQVFVTENSLNDVSEDLTVTLRPISGATQVGKYIRFRVRLKNNSKIPMTNCEALLVNPSINNRREFSYYTWPIKVVNPVKNGVIDIAPGETGQFNLAILPRVAMRREVKFEYTCGNTKAFILPFINTVHLTAKTEPMIAEDFVQLNNSNNRTELIIDRNNGKYWIGYAARVSNTGSEETSVNITTTSNIPRRLLRPSQLCEPLDPVNNNWSCISPRDTQLQVELDAGESKKILVFVHVIKPIERLAIRNRIYLEARDGAGEIVSKTSMGISTIN